MFSKVIMIMVSSLNGKITFNTDSDIYKWTSKEDSEFFFNMIKKSDMVIMGSKTYQSNSDKINPNIGPFRLIITRNPNKFKKKSIPNKLEFTNKSPQQIFNQYKDKYKKILLVGGSEINSLFLKSKLVDQIYLTVEPLIFGKGKNLIMESDLNIDCHLLTIKRLNQNGTIVLKYKTNYEKNKSN